MSAEFVEGGLEIVEDNAVGEALGDERKLPERVDNSNWYDRRYRQDVDNSANDAQAHAGNEQPKFGGYSDNLPKAEFVLEAYVPEKVSDGKDPPWIAVPRSVSSRTLFWMADAERAIPEQRLVGTR